MAAAESGLGLETLTYTQFDQLFAQSVREFTSTIALSRPLCAYPLVARYNGHGSTSQARNFTCAPTYRAR